MPMTQKEKRRRTYLKKLAMQGKEPKYKRDSVLEEFVRIEKSIHPVIKKETENTGILNDTTCNEVLNPTYTTLNEKIKHLEEKLSNSIKEEPKREQLQEYQELKQFDKDIYELKKVFKSVGYDCSDYEKQLLQVYDTKYLYNSKRADLDDLETLNYIIDIKKIIYNSLLKLKTKFRL